MNYSEYMEALRDHLTDMRTLEELIQEAQTNHRVQKLLVGYILKDDRTYKQMLMISQTNPFASKIIAQSKYTLKTIKTGSLYNKPDMKRLVDALSIRSLLSGEQSKPPQIKEWELTGYINIINSYILSEKIEKIEFQQIIEARMKETDWDNLITPVRKNE